MFAASSLLNRAIILPGAVMLLGCGVGTDAADASPEYSAKLNSEQAATTTSNVQSVAAEAPVVTRELVGTWRKTTINFEQPVDSFLKLDSDGTGLQWQATAAGQDPPTSFNWSVSEKTLIISSNGETTEVPFTFYEGQLVLPNIQGRRGFWEKIG